MTIAFYGVRPFAESITLCKSVKNPGGTGSFSFPTLLLTAEVALPGSKPPTADLLDVFIFCLCVRPFSDGNFDSERFQKSRYYKYKDECLLRGFLKKPVILAKILVKFL